MNTHTNKFCIAAAFASRRLARVASAIEQGDALHHRDGIYLPDCMDAMT
ncbi:MAG: hypothetical protein HY308_01715 [Gammaproteobacteria bacterium]|nr:hypothetical protein [Gammaproteobacteria bacterium]